uniref:Uncharacterized protein n=1 Tax=Micrurus corallinus TaxID=54390 RepID=A0A2D4FVN4_MICCO
MFQQATNVSPANVHSADWHTQPHMRTRIHTDTHRKIQQIKEISCVEIIHAAPMQDNLTTFHSPQEQESWNEYGRFKIISYLLKYFDFCCCCFSFKSRTGLLIMFENPPSIVKGGKNKSLICTTLHGTLEFSDTSAGGKKMARNLSQFLAQRMASKRLNKTQVVSINLPSVD